jgi:predicted phosphodiesterase
MRTLIISDIHANLTALEAVLSDAEPFDRVWCLGDVVGYGPDPDDCICRLREIPNLQCIKGNHDAAVSGDIPLDAFNYSAQRALIWMTENISEENIKWLKGLSEMEVIDEITLVHGSPRWPFWEYITDVSIARENMDKFDTRVCLVGHTHFPSIFEIDDKDISSTTFVIKKINEPFSLEKKCIVNPGSVGQPRDHNPKASYLTYDDQEGTWCYNRVSYDILQVQNRIIAAGLPKRQADRLSQGW